MMDEKPRKAILQGIRGDINAIARECYSCATYCYKKGNHQDTISALTGAFELAESYLEYVMCSNLTAEDILKAHVQLKVDAIASLIAHCYRELGDVTKSRIFIGHSILYCGNIHVSLPHGNVDKYVSCVLQELKLQNDGAKLAVAANFKDFTDNATHVFKSRHVSDEQIIRLWIAIRTSLERISGENVVNARTRANRNDADTTISIHSVQLCGALENHLNGVLMKLKYELHDCKNIVDALLEVSESLATRKEVFCTYYCTRKLDRAIKGLVLTYRSLSQAAERLLLFSDKAAVDLGGIYGWRGVIAIEVTMLISYGSTAEEVSDVSDICISEESAIADFERCLMYWREYGDGSGILFDELYKINCLESVCNAVSLISCSAMEQYARTLLKAFQVSANCHNQTVCSTPSATFLVSLLHNDNSCTQLEDGICSDSLVGTEIRSFELVDKELSLAGSSPCSAQAYQHLLNATMMLSKVKNNAKKHSSSTTMKGIGMRELFVHTILSNIYFREGRSKCAISQAKLALRICWKMAKKFAATSSSTEASYFELPQEISLSQWQQQKTTYLASFVAFECSSWDVLFVAKLLLSRIASLYSYFDEPNR
ncbi:unnamed protein product [Phytophthora lilii]|uniref:Unnamed protein product n=1 Tax=Phytophthora lilii TaxID=2077276 RepID=A0A9W6UBJ0_9STRA|nr:unnamed protein product [Phytophthora lilii]